MIKTIEASLTGAQTNAIVFQFDAEVTGGGSLTQVCIQFLAVGTSHTYVFEQSNDGTNWVGCPVWDAAAVSSTVNATLTSLVAPRMFALQWQARYVRMRLQSQTGGTTSIVAVASDMEAPPNNASITVSGTVWMSGQNSSMGGTTSRVKSAASTNATNLRTTAGNVYAFGFFNNAAATRYVKFYSKASAPTVGTDTPLFTVVLPAGGNTEFSSVVPLRFGAGIGYAITAGVADNDTTAVALDDVHGFIHWV